MAVGAVERAVGQQQPCRHSRLADDETSYRRLFLPLMATRANCQTQDSGLRLESSLLWQSLQRFQNVGTEFAQLSHEGTRGFDSAVRDRAAGTICVSSQKLGPKSWGLFFTGPPRSLTMKQAVV
jgi:hypothetical protein